MVLSNFQRLSSVHNFQIGTVSSWNGWPIFRTSALTCKTLKNIGLEILERQKKEKWLNGGRLSNTLRDPGYCKCIRLSNCPVSASNGYNHFDVYSGTYCNKIDVKSAPGDVETPAKTVLKARNTWHYHVLFIFEYQILMRCNWDHQSTLSRPYYSSKRAIN